MEEKNALAQYLGVDVDALEEISYGPRCGKSFVSVEGEYVVYSSYSDAEEDAIESFRSLWDDLGISVFMDGVLNPHFRENIDESWFEDAFHEMNENYAYDIESESDSTYGNRLVEECYDAKVIDDDDFEEDEDGDIDYSSCKLDTEELAERYTEYLDEREDDILEYFVLNFGEQDVSRMIKENNLVDEYALASDVISETGPANELARYDFIENEVEYDGDTYYIYRTE